LFKFAGVLLNVAVFMGKYYSIKDLENFSGIKAHTIRIWEKRYNLLSPTRTETNIRLYNSDQLRKLLNVSVLLRKGLKISKISQMSEQEIFDQVEIFLADILETSADKLPLIEGLVMAAVEFNEARFDKIFSTYVLRSGLKNTMTELVYPFLCRIGILWGINKVSPAQEHFVSNLVRQKLYVATDGLPEVDQKQMSFILFLPAAEYHELGLQFSNFLLRQCGVKVYYLGADVPFESLEEAINVVKPTHLLTFLVTQKMNSPLENYLKNLKNDYPEVQLCIAGRGEYLEELKFDKNVTLLKDVDDLFDILETQKIS
jgi:MerR family transcriptional regulator, light-induced transcriptional regulator